MKFKKPESLEGLDLDAVRELAADALAEANELNAIADDKITREQMQDLIALVAINAELDAEVQKLEAVEAEEAAQLAAAREALNPKAADKDAEKDEDAEEKDEEAETDEADVVREKELVAAGGRPAFSKSFASKVADKAPKGEDVDETADEDPKIALKAQSLSITASANAGKFEAGQELADLDELTKAFMQRAKTFVGGKASGGRAFGLKAGAHGLSATAQRFSVAQLHKPENPFTIEEKDSAEAQFALLKAASDEKRLGTGANALIAAGGWCSPSEQIWGFLELEKVDALLSIPEITARRGGIQFTKGPQLGDLLTETDLGWVMTEAEVEAGEDEKPCFVIECPDWDEVRLDATGFCIRVGLLTNSAYPELVRRYLGLGLLVHARRLNALTIQRISTMIGAATVFAPVGASVTQASATADLLSAIELNVLRLRQQYSLGIEDTVEGVFPLWAKAVVRADLSRRQGVDMISVTDQQITAWFRQRGVLAQFVYDYQNINSGAATTPGGTGAWTRFPDKVEFMLWPAGSYVRLGTDVIDLDTVYDAANLAQNQYTAAFFEEGFAVANVGASGVKVSVGLGNLYGLVGGDVIGDLSAVAPTP